MISALPPPSVQYSKVAKTPAAMIMQVLRPVVIMYLASIVVSSFVVRPFAYVSVLGFFLYALWTFQANLHVAFQLTGMFAVSGVLLALMMNVHSFFIVGIVFVAFAVWIHRHDLRSVVA